MFNSSAIIILFAVFPAFFIIRLAGLYENTRFRTVLDYINGKAGNFFMYVIFGGALFTVFCQAINQGDILENPVILVIAYLLLLTASNLSAFDGFGILLMLFGNVIAYAAIAKAMLGMGGFYYLVMFNAVYCVYSLLFLNLHNLARFLNIKINEGKC